MTSLIFYTNPTTRGRTVRWMLEEIGEPYETVFLELGVGTKSPDYLAINPMGKVPAIKHDETVVTEGAAICAYLADAFPAAGLAPPPADKWRGPYFRWLFFAAGPLESAMLGKATDLLVPPDKAGMAGYGTFEDVVDTMEKALVEDPFLAGDSFTATHLYLGAFLAFGMSIHIIPARKAFHDFVERGQARPAFRRATELDNAAIAKPDSPQ